MYCTVLSCPVLSCPVLSCPVLWWSLLSCPVLSCPVLSCPVLSCPILSCLVLSYPILSYPVLSYLFMIWVSAVLQDMVNRGEWSQVITHFSTYAFMTKHLVAVISKIELALNHACQPGAHPHDNSHQHHHYYYQFISHYHGLTVIPTMLFLSSSL